MRVIVISVYFALYALPAHAPVVEWRLEAVEWREVNLCLKDCGLRAGFVTGYQWRAI